jgi:hypothetical protein
VPAGGQFTGIHQFEVIFRRGSTCKPKNAGCQFRGKSRPRLKLRHQFRGDLMPLYLMDKKGKARRWMPNYRLTEKPCKIGRSHTTSYKYYLLIQRTLNLVSSLGAGVVGRRFQRLVIVFQPQENSVHSWSDVVNRAVHFELDPFEVEIG